MKTRRVIPIGLSLFILICLTTCAVRFESANSAVKMGQPVKEINVVTE